MPPAIRIQDVHKRYGDLRALDGVNLEIESGEIFGLLGPNGAGKTTLISVVAGLARANRGSVQVMGADVVKNYRQARRMLGVVPQELVFDPFFTVREALDIQSGYFGIRNNAGWIEEVMHNLDLTSKSDANMRSLSGGMKRRVLVAQALVHKPPVIVLDEPTAGVDVELRQSLWKFVRRLNADGHTIVLTTHYLEEAELLCGRIGMLKAGRIVALDSTKNLLETFSGLYLKLRLDRTALPECQSLNITAQDGDLFTLRLDDFSGLEKVLADLREAGIAIREFEVQPPDLEEVFVRIMNRH
jgi:ABC-2 type transport system ATP-binding protein